MANKYSSRDEITKLYRYLNPGEWDGMDDDDSPVLWPCKPMMALQACNGPASQ